MPILSVHLVLMLLLGGDGWSNEPPESLRRMFDGRSQIDTAEIDLAHERYFPELRTPEGTIPEQFLKKNITGRLAGPDVIWVDRGDDDGVIMRTPDGTPSPVYKYPFHRLWKDGHWWEHQELTPYASGSDRCRFGVVDYRTLGVNYGVSLRTLDESVWRDPVKQPSARRYREEIEAGGVHVVTAESDVGTIRWWIDPQKGWSPVRCTLTVNGELIAESRSHIRQFDGYWFPETVEYYLKGHKDGREPIESFTVRSAEFNRESHARRFVPEDVGIVPFVTGIKFVNADGNETASGLCDGTALVDQKEAYKRRRELAAAADAARHSTGDGASPHDDAATPSGKQGAASAQETESAWEAYTRRFIQSYGLSQEQSQAAWQVCRDCQERARQYLARTRVDFERVEKGRAELDAREMPPRQRAQSVAQLDGEVRRLRRPIDDIFERQRKPRLDKLPTRAQREAAGATTQPSGRKP